ncbi:uncharacterized protein LOC144318692 [Canis aureus]
MPSRGLRHSGGWRRKGSPSTLDCQCLKAPRFTFNAPFSSVCSFLKGATELWNIAPTSSRRCPVPRRGTSGFCMSTLKASPSRAQTPHKLYWLFEDRAWCQDSLSIPLPHPRGSHREGIKKIKRKGLPDVYNSHVHNSQTVEGALLSIKR